MRESTTLFQLMMNVHPKFVAELELVSPTICAYDCCLKSIQSNPFALLFLENIRPDFQCEVLIPENGINAWRSISQVEPNSYCVEELSIIIGLSEKTSDKLCGICHLCLEVLNCRE